MKTIAAALLSRPPSGPRRQRTCQEPLTPAPARDACHELKILPNGTVTLRLTFPTSVPLHTANLKISGEQYSGHTLQWAPQRMSFPEACLTTQAGQLSCQVLGREIAAAIAAESTTTHLRCFEDGVGGCLCDYDLFLFSSFVGTWTTDGSVMTFVDGSQAPTDPWSADYCASGDTLELTGHDGQSLFGSWLGIRSLTFRRASCSDGVQSQGEEQVDCGGDCAPCAAPSACQDGARGPDEDGIDCGGSCRDLCACFNQQQDPWEEAVDCGGPCALFCSCVDGLQDRNEEGIDCGGDCRHRYTDGAMTCPQ